MSRSVRRASHAGSWYDDDAEVLNRQLSTWLSQADETQPPARAIIAPHAGYRYSGPTAAWAYKHIKPQDISRVFLLGPSHHVYLTGCGIPSVTTYETPLGPIQLDTAVLATLQATGKFERLTVDVDEDEHSLEMHLPYIFKVMENHPFKLVPVMVGSLSTQSEREYGKLLAPYLDDPHTLFVVSSDFCHWGARFRYTYVDPKYPTIWEGIEALDRQGMDAIEQQNPTLFADYLKQFDNSICGKHPIGVLLNAIDKAQTRFNTKFVAYAQSSKCATKQDSSVSYASAVCSVAQS